MTHHTTTQSTSDLVSWDQMTIPKTLARAAALWPDASALEDETEETRFTFAELAAVAEEAARGFIAAGIERGDRVAIWAPNGWRWVVAALGLGTTATHMEWFFGPKGIKFSEIGCRPPGVGAWDLYCAGNEMDVYGEWARAIIGLPPRQRPSRRFANTAIECSATPQPPAGERPIAEPSAEFSRAVRMAASSWPKTWRRRSPTTLPTAAGCPPAG